VSISAPVRVRLRYPDLDTFVERFAPNVTRGGVFIASRAPRPVGEAFAFEVQIATGQVALAGEGKVIWIKEYNPAEPNKPHGMGVQFTNLSPASRDILQRMLKIKGSIPRTGMTGMTGPMNVLARGNGVAVPRVRVDTNVDLAAEYGFDDATLRRALARAWPTGRPSEDDLQALLATEPVEPVAELPHALKELRRMLDPNARRRSGAFRTLESVGAVEKPAPATGDSTEPVNGVSGHGGDK